MRYPIVKKRCPWVGTDDLYIRYHDEEWGVPVYDDRKLFEFLILEGAQAGLSWLTILKKRENYNRVFDNFDASKIVNYNSNKIEALLNDAGIVRNRLKIQSTIQNARAFLEICEHYNSFADYIWSFTDGKPLVNHWKTLQDMPAKTELSDKMSNELKKAGFNFVGSTICYAFMQAVGIVNDHTVDCFRYKEVSLKS
jgi:DNA-3-methyladenine glycosylase I